MFNKEMMEGIARIARGLRKGALIVSAKEFPNPEHGPPLFESIGRVTLSEIQEVDLNFALQERVGVAQEPEPTCSGNVACSWSPSWRRCSTELEDKQSISAEEK